MHGAPHWLPAGYAVDILDPDVLILRRDDGSMVAAFSSRGGTSESVRRTAEEDRRSSEPRPGAVLPLRQQRSRAGKPRFPSDPFAPAGYWPSRMPPHWTAVPLITLRAASNVTLPVPSWSNECRQN